MNLGDLGINGQRLVQRIRNLRFPSVICVEVGVRDGVGSVLMLDATRDKPSSQVIGIDVSPCPPMLLRHPRYTFAEADSVSMLSVFKGPIHVALLDTLHVAHQVAAEVYFLWPLMPVGSLLAFHDAVWPEGKCDNYCGREWPTVDTALSWLFWNKPYASVEVYPESWGMAFVTKTAELPLEITGITWDEVFAGRNELLSVLPSGVAKREITV